MVRICSVDRADILSRAQYGFLDAVAPVVRDREYRNRDQPHRYDSVHALPGDDSRQNAAARLAQSGDVVARDSRREPAIRRADHASDRSLSGRAFLRHAGGRFCRALDAFLLDLRTPGGICPGVAGIRVCVRNHPRFFAEGDIRLSGDGSGNHRDRVHRHERLGASHVHHRHERRCEYILRSLDNGDRRTHRHQNLQLARDYVGRKASVLQLR